MRGAFVRLAITPQPAAKGLSDLSLFVAACSLRTVHRVPSCAVATGERSAQEW